MIRGGLLHFQRGDPPEFLSCAQLRHDRDLDQENRGVTFVVFEINLSFFGLYIDKVFVKWYDNQADDFFGGACGCSTMARAPAFQAGDAGSIPVTRSNFLTYAPVAQLDRATAF